MRRPRLLGVGAERSAGSESIARNTAFSLGTQLTTAAFTAVLILYLARALGPAEFGVFSLALSIATVLLLPTDFGVSQSTARFLAERRGDRAAAAGVYGAALRLKLFIASAVCVAIIAAAGPVASAYDEPDLAWALRGMALSIFGQSAMQLYGGGFVALARNSLNFRLVLSKSVVETGATIALVAAGGGAVGAAFGRAAGYLFGAGVAAALAVRLLGRGSVTPRRHEAIATRRLVGYATALFVIDGAFALFTQVDVLLIGAIIGATAAGLFQAPLRLITFLSYPGYAVANGVAPRLARASAEAPRVHLLTEALRYMVILQAAVVPVMVVWAEPVIQLLLGDEYAESAEVLRALGPYIFLSGLGVLLSLAVNYIGQAARRIPIALGALSINFAIDVILIPEIGIVGGAIGTNVAYALYVPGHLWICKRALGVPLRPLAATLVRALAASAAMAGVLAAFGTSDLAVPLMLLGGVCGAAVYLGALLLTRELSLAELAGLPRELRRRLRAGS